VRLLTKNICDLVLADPDQSFGEDHGREYVMILLTDIGQGGHMWFIGGLFYVHCLKCS